MHCVVPENIIHFFKIFGLREPPSHPMKFQSLLWGEYGYFLDLHTRQKCQKKHHKKLLLLAKIKIKD